MQSSHLDFPQIQDRPDFLGQPCLLQHRLLIFPLIVKKSSLTSAPLSYYKTWLIAKLSLAISRKSAHMQLGKYNFIQSGLNPRLKLMNSANV
jgi:hypothetical protein